MTRPDTVDARPRRQIQATPRPSRLLGHNVVPASPARGPCAMTWGIEEYYGD